MNNNCIHGQLVTRNDDEKVFLPVNQGVKLISSLSFVVSSRPPETSKYLTENRSATIRCWSMHERKKLTCSNDLMPPQHAY